MKKLKITKILASFMLISTLFTSVAFASSDDTYIKTDLTPDGNLTLVDDITVINGESKKQFITATTKNGNYFYIIIDRVGESENVYLLNEVDEADLIALTTGEAVPLPNTQEVPQVEPEIEEKLEVPKEETEIPEVDTNKVDTSQNTNANLPIILLFGAVSFGLAYYFKIYKKNSDTFEEDEEINEENEEN